MSILTWSWADAWYVRGPPNQSCCPTAEVQAIPPAPATCPSPSLRARGRGWRPDGSWGPSSILSAASSPPPASEAPSPFPPPPSDPLLHLPQSKPLSPSARQCCMTGQTQSFTKINPLSLLQLPGLQEKPRRCLKEPSSLLVKKNSFHDIDMFCYRRVPEPAPYTASDWTSWK